MRKPSLETENRSLRRDVARLLEYQRQAERLLKQYEGRVIKAEQEMAEWKRRFDALLERTPKLTAGEV